jgi:hypothetical protein
MRGFSHQLGGITQMAYDKSQLMAFGDAIFKAGLAFQDGFQLTDDSDEILAVGMALVAAADEFKADPVAASLHVAARVADLAGDYAAPQPEPAAGE